MLYSFEMKGGMFDSKSIAANARAKRMGVFAGCAERCGIEGARIVDIGGTIDYWKTNLQYVPKGILKTIDICNLVPSEESSVTIDGVSLTASSGDALDLASSNGDSYDVAYSNSVIEHVGALRDQKKMAETVLSLAKYHFVQTPARYFPIEPHFYFPFFAQLPLAFRARMHQKLNLGNMLRDPDWLSARITCDETRLLSFREFKELFPESVILKEKLFGFTKSYMATNMVNPSD